MWFYKCTATYPELFHSLPCCRHIFQVICRIFMLTNVYCFHFSWQGLGVFCFSTPPFAWGLCVLILCDLKDEGQKGSTFYKSNTLGIEPSRGTIAPPRTPILTHAWRTLETSCKCNQWKTCIRCLYMRPRTVFS